MNEKYATKSEFVETLAKDIGNFIQNGGDRPDGENEKVFNDLSMRLFEYQYNANPVYQKYCDKRGVKPGMVSVWSDVPGVPATAFKEVQLRTFPEEETVLFLTSSGTTNPEKRAKISFNEPMLKIYDLVGISINDRGLYKSADEKLQAIVLGPNPDEMPSVAVGMRQLKISVDRHSKGKPEFFIKPIGFDFAGLAERLRQVEQSGEPCVIVGATFGYVHFFDYCETQGISFKLPEGSRAMDGGGSKGKGREISKDEYWRLGEKVLGLPASHLVNLYGMTEMQAAYFDNVFFNHVRGISEPRYKMIPHFARVVVVDPDTLEPLAKGEKGLLRQHSVANMVTVQAVQTDDMGFAVGSGFQVTGRARDAESRGCSIAYDELISALKA